jgi:hypothetical protein
MRLLTLNFSSFLADTLRVKASQFISEYGRRCCFYWVFFLGFGLNFLSPVLAQKSNEGQKQSEQELLEKLGSLNPQVQRDTIRSLSVSELRNPKIIRLLVVLTADQTQKLSRSSESIQEAKNVLLKNLENPFVHQELFQIATQWDSGSRQAVLEIMKSNEKLLQKTLGDAFKLAMKKETSEPTRQNVAQILDFSGNAGDKIISGLVDNALTARSPFEQERSLELLRAMPIQSKEKIVPRFIEALDESGIEKKLNAMSALPKFKNHDSLVRQVLTRKLDSGNWEVRRQAIKSLGEMALTKQPALYKILNSAFYDVHEEVRSEALAVVKGLDEKTKSEIVQALRQKLKSPYEDSKALHELSNLGEIAKDAIPDLLALVLDPRSMANKNWMAAEILGKIGEHSKSVLPDLVRALENRKLNSWTRERVIVALAGMGPHAKSAKKSLIVALKEKNPDIRLLAAYALTEMDSGSSDVVSALERVLLEDEDENVVAKVSKLLGRTGAPSLNLLQELEKNTKSKTDLGKNERSIVALENLMLANKDGEIVGISRQEDISFSSSDVCKGLCRLVETTQKNILERSKIDRAGGDRRSDNSALVAYENLDSLFLTKASAICRSKEAKGFMDRQLENFLQEPDEKQKKLRELSDREDFSLFKIYSDQFDLLMIKDIVSRRAELKLTQAQIEKLIQRQKSVGENLSSNFERFTAMGSSAMNTYAQACSGIAGCGNQEIQNNPQYKKATQELIDLAAISPTSLPYSMNDKDTNKNSKAAAARAVPVNLLSYLLQSQNKDSQNQLVQALENYDTHKNTLIRHTLFYQGTHNMDEAGVAPYYFYSTIPYAMSALAVLKNNPSTTPENIQKLEKIESHLKTLLLRLIDKDKNAFQPHEVLRDNKKRYEASPRYANALGGLALLAAYGDECRAHFDIPPPPKEAPLLGILSGVDLFGVDAYKNFVDESTQPKIKENNSQSEKH